MDQVAEWMQWRPDWEKESYTEHRDLVLIPVFALVFLSVRYLLDSFIFQVCFAFLFLSYVMQCLLRVPANIMTESSWWIWQCDRNLGHRFFLHNCLHKVLNRLCTYLQSMSGADKITLACCSLNGIAIELFDLALSLAWRFLRNFVDMCTKCNSVFQHFVIVSCLCNLPHISKEPHNSLRLGKLLIFGFSGSCKKRLSETENDADYKTLGKFKESAWKFVYYSTAEVLAIAITYNEPWLTDTKQFWVGPNQQRWPDQKTKLKLKLFYAFTGGFYTYSIFALLFWETRRKDFGVSMSHHVATLFLILISYIARFPRAGSIILALHDASDVFLEIAKLTKYCGSEIVPSIFFVIFALSWVILRLIYFPFYIIWSTSYEVLQVLDKSTAQGPWLYYSLNSLLISLLVLHVYWWILIYRMIMKQVEARGKVSDDVRSDSEDNDNDKEE